MSFALTCKDKLKFFKSLANGDLGDKKLIHKTELAALLEKINEQKCETNKQEFAELYKKLLELMPKGLYDRATEYLGKDEITGDKEYFLKTMEKYRQEKDAQADSSNSNNTL